jgi:hypothetical protein
MFGRCRDIRPNGQRVLGWRTRRSALAFLQAGKRSQNGKEMHQSQVNDSRHREVFPAVGEGAGRLLRAWHGEIRPHSLFVSGKNLRRTATHRSSVEASPPNIPWKGSSLIGRGVTFSSGACRAPPEKEHMANRGLRDLSAWAAGEGTAGEHRESPRHWVPAGGKFPNHSEQLDRRADVLSYVDGCRFNHRV